MRRFLLPLVVLPVLALVARTDTAYANLPYKCQWVSEVTPDAVIRFTNTTGVGVYNGALLYKGKLLIPFTEGRAMGYGSNYWREGQDDKGSAGAVVVFAGNQPLRALASDSTAWKTEPIRLLVVGLGSSLWYGREFSWREEPLLIASAEGFWRPSAGCHRMS